LPATLKSMSIASSAGLLDTPLPLAQALGSGAAVPARRVQLPVPMIRCRFCDCLMTPLEWSAFSRPDSSEPDAWSYNLSIECMHCAACALPANDAFARELRKAEARTSMWRLLVAGLYKMQVMMYACPAYVAAPGDLTLPVVLFYVAILWQCFA
jgi:hypothetical protein